MDNTPYRDRYGEWSGNERGVAPDYDCCCEVVYSGGSIISSQCSRKRGHGPSKAYCKQHDPVAVAYRRAVSSYNYAMGNYNARIRGLGDALTVIQSIAEGNNDPRALCLHYLETNKERLTKPVHPDEVKS